MPDVVEVTDRSEDDECALRSDAIDRGRWRDVVDDMGDRSGSTMGPEDSARLKTGAESSVNGVRVGEAAVVSGE